MRFRLAVLPMILAIVVAGCAPSTSTNTPTATQNRTPVTVIQGSDPASLDPVRDTTLVADNIYENVYDTLASLDNAGRLQPRLATAWTQNANATEWTITLRKGVKFHDGEPWNAAAAKFTIDRVRNPDTKAASVSQMDAIATIAVVDEFTLRLTTKYPMVPLMYAAFTTTYFPSPKAVQADPVAFGRKGVGTGPYTVKEWINDDHLTLEAFPGYWVTAPQVQTLIFKPIKEASSAVAALSTGAADILLSLSDSLSGQVGKDAHVEKLDGLRKMFVVLNTKVKPLDNALVRQALNYAIDKESIVKNLLGGDSRLVGGLVNHNLAGYNEAAKAYPYDPVKAKALLTQAGYPDGFAMEWGTPQGRYPMDREIGDAAVQQLAKVGIKATVKVQEFTQLIGAVRGGTLPGAAYLACIALRGDGDHCYFTHVSSKGTYPLLFNSTKMDDYIAKERETTDPAARTALFKEMELYTVEQAPVIFMFDSSDLFGVSNRLDWKPTIAGFVHGVTIKYK
jgi:peptide/nickel transport system substrate-binding protein